MRDKPKRRWFQFSIRTLLLLTTTCAVIAWMGAVRQRGVAQHRLVQSLPVNDHPELYLPVVRYDFERDGRESPRLVPGWLVEMAGVDCFADVVEVNVGFSPPGRGREGAAFLARLHTLRGLEGLSIHGLDINDDDLPLLNHHKKLSSLKLYFSDISGVGLANASFRNRLRVLSLHGCPVTDEGLAVISTFENLEEINLTLGNGGLFHRTFSPAGLANLRPLTHLRKIVLGGVEITDQDLIEIANHGELEELRAEITWQISKQSILKLKGLTKLKRLDLWYDFVVFFREGSHEQVFDILGEMMETRNSPEMRDQVPERFWSELKNRVSAHATIGNEYTVQP